VWLVSGARIPARRATELLGKHGGETPTVSLARLRAARWATELLGKHGGETQLFRWPACGPRAAQPSCSASTAAASAEPP